MQMHPAFAIAFRPIYNVSATVEKQPIDNNFREGYYLWAVTVEARVNLLAALTKNLSVREITRQIHRSSSSVSREIKRNTQNGKYQPSQSSRLYKKRRKNCRRKRLLDNPQLSQIVQELLHVEQWSPEQISNILRITEISQISFTTIYRLIPDSGRFFAGFPVKEFSTIAFDLKIRLCINVFPTGIVAADLQEVKQITWEQFIWLMQGLSVEHPKAIQPGKPKN